MPQHPDERSFIKEYAKWISANERFNKDWTPSIGDEVMIFSNKKIIIVGTVIGRVSNQIRLIKGWLYESPLNPDQNHSDDCFRMLKPEEVRLIERRPS